jgi:transmembrane protein DUF3566
MAHRSKRTITAVDVRSVVRSTFALSVALWAIVGVGVIALYLLGLVSGGLGGIEGFIASVGFTGFRLSIFPFLAVFVVIAGLASAAVAILVGLLSYLYNLLLPIVGGVQVGVEETQIGPSRAPRPEFSRLAEPPRTMPRIPEPDLEPGGQPESAPPTGS